MAHGAQEGSLQWHSPGSCVPHSSSAGSRKGLSSGCLQSRSLNHCWREVLPGPRRGSRALCSLREPPAAEQGVGAVLELLATLLLAQEPHGLRNA